MIVTARQAAWAAALALAASSSALAQGKNSLFEGETPIEMRLSFDFKTVFKDRDTLSKKRYPATLTYVDSAGAPVALNIFVRPRGHWRLLARNCAFVPIRLILPKDSTRKSLFAGRSSLKLATHCQNKSGEFEQYVYREYAVYKVFNLITDKSYRARFVHATYVDRGDTATRIVKPAYLIEDDESMAKHAGGTLAAETRRATFADVDAEQMNRVALFEYLIGNTDWSLYSLHNIRLVVDEKTFTYYPVAYDFDFSGLVHTRYATPDPRLNIKSVRDRLYRGPCRTHEQMASAYAAFNTKRDAIAAVYRGMKELDQGYVKEALDYIDEFYKVINDPRRAKSEIETACPGPGV